MLDIIVFTNEKNSIQEFHRLPLVRCLARRLCANEGRLLLISHYLSLPFDNSYNIYRSVNNVGDVPNQQIGTNIYCIKPVVTGNLTIGNRVPFLLSILKNQIKAQVLNTMVTAGFSQNRPRVAWLTHPYHLAYLGLLGESLAVYDCYDDFSLYGKRKADKAVLNKERELARHVDVIFASSDALVNRLKPFNDKTYLFNSAVNVNLAWYSYGEYDTVPMEVRQIRKPIIGFAGCLKASDDLSLLKKIIKMKPQWSFVFVGAIAEPVRRLFRQLCNFPNVIYLGNKSLNEYMKYIIGFDVGIMPFKISKLTSTYSPYKMYDYVAAGVPIVSTPIPEVLRFNDIIEIASTPEEYVSAIEKSLLKNSQALRSKYLHIIKSENWDCRAKFAIDVIHRSLKGYENIVCAGLEI